MTRGKIGPIPALLTGPSGATVLYLLDAASDYEAAMLERWLAGDGGPKPTRCGSRRRGGAGAVTSMPWPTDHCRTKTDS